MSLRLNLGCGPLRLPGELGVDRESTSAADVRADILALPFRNGAAELCRLDHVLEHLPVRLAVPALLEARRVLQPGGRIRIGVPDLAATCRRYAESTSLREKAWLLRSLYGSQAHDGEHHKSGWDAQTLADLLSICAFVDVQVGPDPDRDEGICLKGEARKP